MSHANTQKPRVKRTSFRTTMFYYQDTSGAERDTWFVWHSRWFFRPIEITEQQREAGMLPITGSWPINMN